MGIAAIIRAAREKQKQANTAEAKELRAVARIKQAETKAQLDKARMDLRMAKLERQRKEISARIALEKAKTEVERAKTSQAKASEEKLKARYRRVATAAFPATVTARVAGRGLGKLAGYLWDEPNSSKRRKQVGARRKSVKKSTRVKSG